MPPMAVNCGIGANVRFVEGGELLLRSAGGTTSGSHADHANPFYPQNWRITGYDGVMVQILIKMSSDRYKATQYNKHCD